MGGGGVGWMASAPHTTEPAQVSAIPLLLGLKRNALRAHKTASHSTFLFFSTCPIKIISNHDIQTKLCYNDETIEEMSCHFLILRTYVSIVLMKKEKLEVAIAVV